MATYTNQNGTSSADTLTYNKQGTYHALAGNDTIKITGGSGIVVHTDSGNNVITVTGGSQHTVKVAAENADSDKQNGVEKLTVNGANMVEGYLGAGKDEIVMRYTDGKKSTGALSLLHGSAWGDSFDIGNGTKNYQLYGDAGDDSFNITNGSNIICWGGAANDTFNVTGGTGIKLRGGDSADEYNIEGQAQAVDMQLGYGNDIVRVEAGDNHTIKANLGINSIYLNKGSEHVITADIDQAASRKQGYTETQIKNGQGVGYGVDKLYIGAEVTHVTAHLGDGKDKVTLYGSGHTIFTEGWGDEVEVHTSNNSTIYTGGGEDKVTFYDNSTISNTVVNLGDGNDTITLYSGITAKNNEVRGGAGNDSFIITGKDLTGSKFYGETGRDDFRITNVSNLGVWCGGVEANKIYVYKDKNEKLVLQGGDGADHIYATDYSGEPVHTRLNYSYLNGNGGDDDMYLSGNYNMMAGGAGKDNLFLRSGYGNMLYAGAGDDTIMVQGANNLVRGGAGADNITVQDEYITVYGGAGNDSITVERKNTFANKEVLHSWSLLVGGAGNDTYKFADTNNLWIDAKTDAASGDRDVINMFATEGKEYFYKYDSANDILGIDNIYIEGVKALSAINFVDYDNPFEKTTFTGTQLVAYAKRQEHYMELAELDKQKLKFGQQQSASITVAQLGNMLGEVGTGIAREMLNVASADR